MVLNAVWAEGEKAKTLIVDELFCFMCSNSKFSVSQVIFKTFYVL